MGFNVPLHRGLSRVLGDGRADDEPAVIVLHTPIQQLQVTVEAFDSDVPMLGLGCDGQLPAVGKRNRNDVAFSIMGNRAVRLKREYPRGVIHVPALAEQRRREKFEIEADAADPFVRQRTIEVHGNQKPFTPRLDADIIYESEIRIDQRIEPL